jgi:hypothetical protein
MKGTSYESTVRGTAWLASLAAYTIRMANAIDRFRVAGVDLAIYRDANRPV